MIRTSLLLLFFVLTFSACNKDGDEMDTQVQPVSLTSYPLTIGNKWVYYTEAKQTYISSQTPFQIEKCLSTMEVVGDTIINGEVVMKMAMRDSFYHGVVSAGYYYFVNRPSGFYLIAASAAYNSRVEFKSASFRGDYLFHQGMIQSSPTDSLYLPDSSTTFLKFPLVLGESWHGVRYSPGFYFDRKYEAFYSLTTDAGIFNCVRVKGMVSSDTDTIDPDDNLKFHMYYSSKGLVRSHFYSTLDIGGGPFVFSIDSKLTSVNF
jgi:hypothetical protein